MATTTMTATTATTQPEHEQRQHATHDSSYIPRGAVGASLKFYDGPADGSKPFNYPLGTEPPAGMPRRNFDDADITVTIHDIRGHEANYTIDTNAFTTLRGVSSSSHVDFTSDTSIKTVYYPEIEDTLRTRFPDATRIFIFDHTVRPSAGTRPPALRTHIDQSPNAAIGRVRALLGDDADSLLQSRVRIINVWRPLKGPVQLFPLAFADSATVRDEDLHVVEHRYAERTGETLSLAHANESWLYWSGMENEERLLIQCYDSEKGGSLAHTAFEDPRTPPGAKERESIEVRALVFGG